MFECHVRFERIFASKILTWAVAVTPRLILDRTFHQKSAACFNHIIACIFEVDVTNQSENQFVTASCYRSLNALTEVEEPAEMGGSLGTGAHRQRSILPPGVKYVPGPRVLRRILSNRS